MHTRGFGKNILASCVICGLTLQVGAADAQDPWADNIVSYEAGSGAAEGYTEPATALGEPARMTGSAPWEGAVTPFNPPWLTDQIVSLGAGGHLIVGFEQPITNDPGHLYGVDFMIFGNGGFIDANWPAGQVGGLLEEGPFSVSVSFDGIDFVTLDANCQDAMFPTLGYSDLEDPYAVEPGLLPSDFTKPMNPALTYADFDGLTFDQIVPLYDGSGGGIPFDIAGSGLDEIFYVRVDVPDGAVSPEFDAFVAVPEPAWACLFSLALFGALRRGR